jgi:micrococcal nuclease
MSKYTLENCTYKNTPKFCVKGKYIAKCVKVYDGDTITVAIVPFDGFAPCRFSCRCLRYNTAEIRTKDKEEKKKAVVARDYLRGLILDKIIEIDVVNDGNDDPYGRLLVEVFIDGVNINQDMLDRGYGKPYEGVGPKTY